MTVGITVKHYDKGQSKMSNSVKSVSYRKKELGHTRWGEVGVGG